MKHKREYDMLIEETAQRAYGGVSSCQVQTKAEKKNSRMRCLRFGSSNKQHREDQLPKVSSDVYLYSLPFCQELGKCVETSCGRRILNNGGSALLHSNGHDVT